MNTNTIDTEKTPDISAPRPKGKRTSAKKAKNAKKARRPKKAAGCAIRKQNARLGASASETSVHCKVGAVERLRRCQRNIFGNDSLVSNGLGP